MADDLDDLTELEKEAWAEFQKTLDDYIAKYSEAIGRFLESLPKEPKPPVDGGSR